MANSSQKSKNKIIIDTDCGVDDAHAILMALSKEYEESLDILAITCVSGNVHVDQVCVNVLKVLEASSRTDIPVYKGAYKPLLAHKLDATHFHGKDGLGDASDIPDPDMDLLKKEHAVDFLVQTVAENPGEITLVALAPLTNLALACQMDPAFCTSLKKVCIMGGNMEGRGNVSVCSEFNFHFDPESAYIVLDELSCPVEILTWEVSLRYGLDNEFMAQYLGQKTKKGEFVEKITASTLDFKVFKEDYGMCDEFAMAIAVDSDVVSKREEVFATVELQGQHTRGQMVVDWHNLLGRRKNVLIPMEIDMVKFKSLLMTSVQ